MPIFVPINTGGVIAAVQSMRNRNLSDKKEYENRGNTQHTRCASDYTGSNLRKSTSRNGTSWYDDDD